MISKMIAIKRYFERVDAFAPNGGRKVESGELLLKSEQHPNGLNKEDRDELATLCAIELGEEVAQ